jgi:hypothetical protein
VRRSAERRLGVDYPLLAAGLRQAAAEQAATTAAAQPAMGQGLCVGRTLQSTPGRAARQRTRPGAGRMFRTLDGVGWGRRGLGPSAAPRVTCPQQ